MYKFFKSAVQPSKGKALNLALGTLGTALSALSFSSKEKNGNSNGQLVYNPAGTWQYLPLVEDSKVTKTLKR